jgi:cold shock CspA family protein
LIGHVKFFNVTLRYGFIVPEGKRPQDKADNVFFHETAVTNGIRGPIDGAEIEYELIPNYGGKKVLSARLTGRVYAPVAEMRRGAAHGD